MINALLCEAAKREIVMAIDNYEKLKTAMLSSLIDSEYEKEITRLLELKEIEDKELQAELVRLISEKALSDDTVEFTEYMNARVDMASRVLYLNGFNPQGEVLGNILSKDEFHSLLDVALGREDGFVDNGVVTLLLKYQKDKDSYKINPEIKSHLDEYLVGNLARVVDIANEKRIKHTVLPSEVSRNNDEQAEDLIPVSELVSENELDVNVATVERDALDYEADYVRTLDQEVEAKKAISKLIERARAGDPANNVASVNYVERKVVDKLKSFVKNKAADALDPIPLQYPSESLFSDSLSEMDDNGRVTKVHLHYRKDKVVMPSANSPREVYDIMAAKVMEKGIKHPYIKANFSNPQDAEKFIRNIIKSLTDLGYDIEDMRCHPKNQVLFDNIKARYTDMINTIEEAPEIEPELELDQEFPTLEEANMAVTELTLARLDAEQPVPVEQFTTEQLDTALQHHKLLTPIGVDVHGDEVKLTERNAETVNIVSGYVEKLINKSETERGLGSRELEKLTALSPDLLKEVFSDKPELLEKLDGLVNAQNAPRREVNAPPMEGNEPPPMDNDAPPMEGNEPPPMGNDAPPMEGNEQPPMDNGAPPMEGNEPPPMDYDSPPIGANEPPPNWAEQGDPGYDPNVEPPAGMENGYDENGNPLSLDGDNAPVNNPEPVQKNEMSSADEFMKSIALSAKKNEGDLSFMSSKQIKAVAVVDARSKLDGGHENKVELSKASVAMINKVKESVLKDINGMVAGERVSKERYKALASQNDKVINILAGKDAMEALEEIKQKSASYKAKSKPAVQEVNEERSPDIQKAPSNIQGETSKADDMFSLPKADYEKPAIDIPRRDDEVSMENVLELPVDELLEMQKNNPEKVRQAISHVVNSGAMLPSDLAKLDKLPESIKSANKSVMPDDEKVEQVKPEPKKEPKVEPESNKPKHNRSNAPRPR
jgi:hypothetical protein